MSPSGFNFCRTFFLTFPTKPHDSTPGFPLPALAVSTLSLARLCHLTTDSILLFISMPFSSVGPASSEAPIFGKWGSELTEVRRSPGTKSLKSRSFIYIHRWDARNWEDHSQTIKEFKEEEGEKKTKLSRKRQGFQFISGSSPKMRNPYPDCTTVYDQGQEKPLGLTSAPFSAEARKHLHASAMVTHQSQCVNWSPPANTEVMRHSDYHFPPKGPSALLSRTLPARSLLVSGLKWREVRRRGKGKWGSCVGGNFKSRRSGRALSSVFTSSLFFILLPDSLWLCWKLT